MTKLIFSAALLIAIIQIPVPAYSQSVTLEVCNTGTVDIDVFISSTGGAPFSSHIRPMTCEVVAQGEGALDPAYVGLAFTDSKGKWGAPRRFAGVPYMGVKTLPLIARLALLPTGEKEPDPVDVLSLATTNVTVSHGNKDVSLPLQLLFQPQLPNCHTFGGYSAESNLSLNASAVERSWARSIDAGGVAESSTICEELDYTLMVEAYPDSREARLDSLPLSGRVMGGPPVNFSVEKNEVNWAEEESDRKQREEPEAVKWADLLAALRRVRYGGPTVWDVLPPYFLVRGTVAGVEVREKPTGPDTTIPVAEITFRESPLVEVRPDWSYSEFDACTARLDMLEELFGADFRTSMVGKTIEVRGNPGGSLCYGTQGAFEIVLARQIKAVKSAEFAAGTKVWVPPPVEVKPLPPLPGLDEVAASIVSGAAQLRYHEVTQKQAQLRLICDDQYNQLLEENPGGNSHQQYLACLQEVGRYPETGPAPAYQEQMAAQERAIEKARPCARELLTAHPDQGRTDHISYNGAFNACVEAQREPLPPAAMESDPKYKPGSRPESG